MNIDEVESGKGLRFLPSEKTCKSPDEVFNYPGTRHELQQRRVRARRKMLRDRIDTLKKVYKGCNPIITKIERGPVQRGTFVLTAIKDSQIHVVYV